ncbi:methyl-accepting chemotaxis protein [Paenibacillus dauci]|uniref:methyl-accepting chemotaxis protein n=1 Tax=Paenibacillus dauci TaxID=1567106 RepID=UPI000B11DC84|nr:HAMP domain-containing methyl-accepting chemotaxis protein [Paenibacillus dauci]
MSTHWKWSNLKIGMKYMLVFALVSVIFLSSVAATYTVLQTARNTMETSSMKSWGAMSISELLSLYNQKYNHIPEYILLSDDRILTNYLDDSMKFTEIAKQTKTLLSLEQIQTFNQILENNDKLDQYFFSTIVPNVQNINTQSFGKLQADAEKLKSQTMEAGNQLKEVASRESGLSIEQTKAGMTSTVTLLIVSGIASILIGFILMYLISRKVNKDLNKVVQASDRIAEGQLNNEPLVYTGNDEIGMLSDSINRMGASLQNMIREVQILAGEMDTHGTSLSNVSGRVKENSEQIAITIEELASGASSQATETADIAESTQQFSGRLDRARAHSEELVTFSGEALNASVKGDHQMKASLEQMNVINHVMNRSVDKVASLEAKTHSITEITDVIKSIAKQTNLLALNASIEAARAGEAGKGFAVVAGEIRKLSEEVSRSVEDITGVISDIQQQSTVMSEELKQGYAEVTAGTEKIEITGQYFAEIKQYIEDMTGRVTAISDTVQHAQGASNQINEAVNNSAAISEESAAGAQQISASVHEQRASIDHISSSVYQLKEMVERMNTMIGRFHL